ncbi:enoyl-CoA hydratase/isomerase family protein [Rhodococcus hoagii]|nr:enoyl-CoA hydratase/isomerase family protein [Prescottella equi]
MCAQVEADPKPLLLTGRGEHFAGGADIGQLRARMPRRRLAGINRTLFDRIGRLPLPTVAAVSGFALAAAPNSRMRATPHRHDHGQIRQPRARLGIMRRRGQAIGATAGRDVGGQAVLLGGHILDADAAFRAGLITRSSNPTRTRAAPDCSTAHRIARSSPLALRLTKTIVDSPGTHPFADDIAQRCCSRPRTSTTA